MPFGIGPLELIIVLVIVLVIFGPKRLPGLGRSLGTGIREFKDSISGKDESESKQKSADPERIERTGDSAAPRADGDAEPAEKQVFGGERRG